MPVSPRSTSGGAIPDVADYRVVLEPEETLVGTVNEDWAIESMAGDVFLLGSATWRIRRVETGTVRVVDAEGASPTRPVLAGGGPGPHGRALRGGLRAAERSSRTGRRRRRRTRRAVELVESSPGSTVPSPEQVVAYLAAAMTELGALPTTDRFVIERFFDDTGGMQLVVHSPRGARVNRGLGLALRKRFCRTFDFELQAAASDDAVVLSLGPQHSFPLEEVLGFLSPATVRDTLSKPCSRRRCSRSRWRWNLTRSLVAPRYRGSRRVPPAIQRMEADDLMAAIFPALAACQENVSGPIEIPDHPIVRQTLDDCCTEAMDLDGLTGVLGQAPRRARWQAHCVDTVIPSVLAEEILNGRPYTFLDDAPLEERRTRAVTTRRGLPLEARDLAALDPGVVARIVEQARPELRNAEELHDLLCSLVLAAAEAGMGRVDGGARRLRAGRWASSSRAARAGWRSSAASSPPPSSKGLGSFPTIELAGARPQRLPARETMRWSSPAAGTSSPRARSTLEELSASIGTGSPGEIRSAIARLVAEGSVLACRVAQAGTPAETPAERFCARHLLARIHSAMRDGSRRSVEAVSPQQFMRFLLVLAARRPRCTGCSAPEASLEVIEQLQGYEAAVDAWESSILPARVAGYHAALLDEWCARGEVSFGRLASARRTASAARPGAAEPLPRRRRRSACSGARTWTGSSSAPATTSLAELPQRRGRRWRSSRCCGATAPCS